MKVHKLTDLHIQIYKEEETEKVKISKATKWILSTQLTFFPLALVVVLIIASNTANK